MDKNELLLKNLNLINPASGKITAERHREINKDIIEYVDQKAGTGWTRDYVDEDYGVKRIRKVTGYYGGSGDAPTDFIGLYFSDGGFTSDKDLAADYRAEVTNLSAVLSATSTSTAPSDKAAADYVKDVTAWNYPYINTPVSDLQKAAAKAVKEIYIENYDPLYKYYLIQFARNIDQEVYGYSTNEYVVKIRREKISDPGIFDIYKIQFGNNDPLNKIPTVISFPGALTVLVDWSAFPEFGNFDVDPADIYLLDPRVGVKSNAPLLFPSFIKKNNGGKNTYFFGAGKNATDGEYNLGIGDDALENVSTAGYNLAIGYRSLKDHSTGAGNIAIGMDAMRSSLSCIDVTMIGWEAGKSMTTGVGDTGLGRRALALTLAAGGNTGIGDSALYSVQYNAGANTGGGNVAVGYTAGEYCISLSNSILLGIACARNISGGFGNIILGSQAMLNRTTASTANVAIGVNTMLSATGDRNVVVGAYTMNDNAGNENVVVGYNAGGSLTNGSRNVYIGTSTGSGAVNCSDSIAIGNEVKPTASNQILLGSSVQTEFIVCGVSFTKAQLMALKALL